MKNLEELDRDGGDMQGTLWLEQPEGNAENSWDVFYSSPVEFAGFQFEVGGGKVLNASIGDFDTLDEFSISSGNNIILGFSFTLASIPAGSGEILVHLELDGAATGLSNVIMSDSNAQVMKFEFVDMNPTVPGCMEETACNYDPTATEDNATCFYASQSCWDGGMVCDASSDCLDLPTITIVEPTANAVIEGSDVTVVIFTSQDVTIGSDSGEHHLHSYFNGVPAEVDGTGSHMAYDSTFTLENVALGNHTLEVRLADDGHTEYGVSAQVPFSTSTIAPSVNLSFGNVGTNTMEIMIDTNVDVAGYQFDIVGGDLTIDADGASGGLGAAAGHLVSNNDNTVLGFGLNGEIISAGSQGVMTNLSFSMSQSALICIANVVIGDSNAESLPVTVGDCVLPTVVVQGCTEATACNYDPAATADDGTCEYALANQDCAGNCTADLDCAGVCGGTSVLDCAGVCGGTAENCPDWVDCPSCYENTASMTAIVLNAALSGEQMYDHENDMLVAFDDTGTVRGLALSLYPIPFGPYETTGLHEIQIRGDEAGDDISFKYYDSSADEVLDSSTHYTFVIDDIIGDVINPHEISVGAVELIIDIASGWNWFSLNVEGDDMSMSNVMNSLTSTEGDFIKSASASSTYYPDFGWYGGLEELGVTGMYKFSSANADSLAFTGPPVAPLSTPIDLASGWNWVGFTPQNDGSTSDALSTINTTDGDFIKNQEASSTYYDDFGWYGGLEVMAPTEGYMLSVAEASTLTYPDFGLDDARDEFLTDLDDGIF